MFTPRAVLVVFAMSVSAICEASAPDYPPTPSDSKLAAAFEEAKALMDRGRVPGYMDLPANPQPWPCEVPELQLRKYAGALNTDETGDKVKVATRKATLNVGMAGDEMKVSIRDVNIAPLLATCKNGLLDGPLEFIIEYTRATESPASIAAIRMRVRKLMTLAAGEQVMQAPERTSMLQISAQNTYRDPAMQARMAKIKRPEPKMVVGTYVLPLNADDAYIVNIMDMGAGGVTTKFHRPTGPKRTEVTTYKGAALLSVMRTKNGLSHGEQRIVAQTFGTTTVPEKITCFEDGEIILTTQCDVN